jgi:hypothetical protein
MSKKSESIVIDRNESDDESDDDVDIIEKKATKKMRKNTNAKYEFGHSCKLSALMFIMFILIMSDVFIERVMSKTKLDLVTGRTPTKKGMCAQGVILALSLIVLDFLINKEKI